MADKSGRFLASRTRIRAALCGVLLMTAAIPVQAQIYGPKQEWKNRFMDLGKTQEERDLRAYVVNLEGVTQHEGIIYTQAREDRLVGEKDRAIQIVIELFEFVPPEAAMDWDGMFVLSIASEDLETLARKVPDLFHKEHLERLYQILVNRQDRGDRLLPVMGILRRRESLPHLAAVLDQQGQGRSHGGAIRVIQNIGHPDGIEVLETFAKANPTKVNWVAPVIEGIRIDNLPADERLSKWEEILRRLAEPGAFSGIDDGTIMDAKWDTARWVLDRLGEHGDPSHIDLVLGLVEATSHAGGEFGIRDAAEETYHLLVSKLPLAERVAVWRNIVKDVTDQFIVGTYGPMKQRCVWAVTNLGIHGGPDDAAFLQSLLDSEGLFKDPRSWEIRKAINSGIQQIRDRRERRKEPAKERER